jgi:hypothetical protein
MSNRPGSESAANDSGTFPYENGTVTAPPAAIAPPPTPVVVNAPPEGGLGSPITAPQLNQTITAPPPLAGTMGMSVADYVDGQGWVPRTDPSQRQWSEGSISGTPPPSGDNPQRPA